jgi:hypothetical protein
MSVNDYAKRQLWQQDFTVSACGSHSCPRLAACPVGLLRPITWTAIMSPATIGRDGRQLAPFRKALLTAVSSVARVGGFGAAIGQAIHPAVRTDACALLPELERQC